MRAPQATWSGHTVTRFLVVLALLAVTAGGILRIMSFGWNDRLQGDVNLFALTAREFVHHNRLYYPMKFEFTDNVEYEAMESPASQHPPGWPLVAGLVGKAFQTDSTFYILKIVCEIFGALLIIVVACAGMRFGWRNEMLIAVSCISLSPMLVDFSANGSPYILSSSFLLASMILLRHFRCDQVLHYLLGGLLGGLGMQVHSLMICVPVALVLFGTWQHSRIKWQGVVSFILAMLLTLAPSMCRNLRHFGEPFHSYSTYYFLKKVGIAEQGIYGNIISTRAVRPVTYHTTQKYASLIADSTKAFLILYLMEVGPFCVSLGAIGVVALLRKHSWKALMALLPFVCYIVIVLLWPSFKYRFLVPVLPITYALSAVGLTRLFNRIQDRRSISKVFAGVCLLGTVFWGVLGFFERPRTRYYFYDLYHEVYYNSMQPLAKKLREQDPGVVLGYSHSLDGGLETIYWHRLPFVYGRESKDNSEFQKLIHDFDVRYVWADDATIDTVRSRLPEAKVILQNQHYRVFEIPR
jgi:hypothetical protein